MPAETHIKPKLAVKLEKAEWWQQPPVLRRELLHAGSVAELHLLEMHDKMVKMDGLMVLMSTGHVESHTAR